MCFEGVPETLEVVGFSVLLCLLALTRACMAPCILGMMLLYCQMQLSQLAVSIVSAMLLYYGKV